MTGLNWLRAPCAFIVLLAACGAASAASSMASSPGKLIFAQGTYSVQQGVASVTVVVDRIDGSKGAVSVKYATANGVAIAGTNYTATSGTLTWSSGGTASKKIKVTLRTGAPFSGTKWFAVQMLRTTGGVTLTVPYTTRVLISGAKSTSTASPGSIALSAATYSVTQNGGSAVIDLQRTGGSSGAVTVNYATSNGTATAGTNYTAASGTVSWANGDVSTKSFSVPVSNATPFTGSKTFTVTLSGPTDSATLVAPKSATVSITGSEAPAGTVALSSASYTVPQSSGAAVVSVARTGGSSGVASVNYATANGSAVAGTDYTATQGTLNWASGDTTAKTFSVAVSTAQPFTGSKTFGVSLSAPVDSSLGTPAAGTVAIAGSGSQSTTCAQNSSSYATSDDFGYVVYGNYVVNNNNWGGTPGQKFWANSADCWGVTTTSTVDGGSPGSYPNATRGWSSNGGVMEQLSDPGTSDWTTKSGMGISVTAITQATAHWAFTAPTGTTRWMGLMDIYFHKTNSPDYTQFPPYTDLMVDQALQDQVFDGTTFYSATAQQDHATTVTLGGVQFVIYVDDSSEDSFHNGGHTIHLFELPTAYTSNNANPVWGSMNSRIDIMAIINYLRQSNPVDDNGKPLVNAQGKTITSPLITDDLYLNAVNAGWEIITGTPFTNTSFCLAMQNEPACP